MKIDLPYGRKTHTAHLPDGQCVDIISAPKQPGAHDPSGVVGNALEILFGEVRWGDYSGARSVAIAINDKTRPVPHHHLLPPLLNRLSALGIANEAITFYIAVGSHSPMTPKEFPMVLSHDILQRYNVISHNAEDLKSLVFLGETTRGTPIWSNKDYVKSDLKIVVGNIEPHQFVGFSGGVKSAAIGLSGLQTINQNHTMMLHPDAQLGEYTTNPARQDVEEIGQKIFVHLALNAILNQDKEIVHALAGDPIAVMEEGVALSREVCQVGVGRKYDLVLASPGGHPKDINLYQSQKGLAHAVRIAKPGATVILAAACPEGTGSQHYEEWASGHKSYAQVIERFQAQGFQIGPHKAYQIARDASRVRLKFFSEMDKNLTQALLLNPIQDLQATVDAALVDMPTDGCVGVLPHATSTIPYYVRAVADDA